MMSDYEYQNQPRLKNKSLVSKTDPRITQTRSLCIGISRTFLYFRYCLSILPLSPEVLC